MKLDPKKCKEIIVSFRRDIEHPPTSLAVDNISLERVESYKVLGLTIQNSLKWDSRVSEIVTKASKRVHIIFTSSQTKWSFIHSPVTSIFHTSQTSTRILLSGMAFIFDNQLVR